MKKDHFGSVGSDIHVRSIVQCFGGRLRKAYPVGYSLRRNRELIFGVSGIIFAMFAMLEGSNYHPLVVISCILAALLAVISLANCGVLCYNTFKGDVKTGTKAKQLIWALLGIAYAVFIVTMQLYCFRKL